MYEKGNSTISQIQHTMESAQTLNASTMSHLQQLLSQIKSSLPAEHATGNKHVEALQTFIDESLINFRESDTEYKRQKVLARNGLVLPRSWKIGTRSDITPAGEVKIVDVNVQYVSVIDTLTSLAQNTISASKHDGLLHSFEDTSTFIESDFYSKYPSAYRITLYHDDIECGNSLGSRAGVNKMTMFYMSVGNGSCDTCTKGKLTSIHLVLICHAADLSTYGYEPILRPLLDDLAKLNVGVEVISGDYTQHTLRARLEHLAGDNLAANQILGLVSSFSNTYFCRFCYINSADATLYSNNHDAPKRTATTHQVDVETAASCPDHYKKSGVKGACVFDELPYFSGVDSTVPDIM